MWTRAFGVVAATNALGFLASAAIKSEVLTDLLGVGSIGVSAVVLTSRAPRQLLVAGAIALWSARLAGFLAHRAFLHGDARFAAYFPPPGPDGQKEAWSAHPRRLGSLAGFWAVQALWGCVMLTPFALLRGAFGAAAVGAGAGWPGLAAAGLAWAAEAAADQHKARHKQRHGRDAMPTTGLFALVQYPNYTAEIAFWAGLGWYWSAELRGPLRLAAFLPAAFVALLLTRVSGIPLSEQSRDRRPQSPEVAAYRRRTAWLVPGLY